MTIKSNMDLTYLLAAIGFYASLFALIGVWITQRDLIKRTNKLQTELDQLRATVLEIMHQTGLVNYGFVAGVLLTQEPPKSERKN